MVCYPEAQKKAQAELDEVLNGRLPEHSDFPSLPYVSALVKEIYRYVAVCFEYPLLRVNCVSRWNPVFPLSRSLFLANMMVRSWHPYLFKASRTSRSSRTTMISITTIISPPIPLWSLIYGDSRLLQFNFNFFFSFLKLYPIGRCWTTNGTIQTRMNSSPSAIWKMESSTVRLETRWTLHLGSEGGELLHHESIFPCLLSESSPFL